MTFILSLLLFLFTYIQQEICTNIVLIFDNLDLLLPSKYWFAVFQPRILLVTSTPEIRLRFETDLYIQPDQINTAVFFWHLVITVSASTLLYNRSLEKSCFTRYQKHRPCMSGHPVPNHVPP